MTGPRARDNVRGNPDGDRIRAQGFRGDRRM